ncbi:MAG: ABC-2 type transport system ATP-binding protein [Chlamydiales bacterium]|jgi:ABC-2 type transport system ATP-binding protein
MIRVRGLTKCYGDVRAVDDVAFELHAGELVGFLGPNGAGKSTTMRMLTGYLLPDAGEVSIAGMRMAPGNMDARARIGYLPEHTPLYRKMRVDRYLAFVAEVHGLDRAGRRDAIERVVQAFDLDGYTTRRIATLSKGYRQRVGLAQALIADPDVLVLDEPTSGLDPAEIVRIRDLIVELSSTKTILLSTHVLSEIEEVCRRAIILAGGRIVADGSILELSESEGDFLALTVDGPEAEVLAALPEVDGVRRVSIAGRGAHGRLRVRISVEARFDVGPRIVALVQSRGWTLFELSHEASTLENVFLERTRGLGRGRAIEPGPEVSA